MEKLEFQEKIKEVASILKMEVTFDENACWNRGELKKENLIFSIKNGDYRNKDRIVINPIFPRAKDGFYCRPYSYKSLQITVSEISSASRIADAIQKRLLPQYQPFFEKALEIKEKHNEYLAGKENILKRLQEYFPFGEASEYQSTFFPHCENFPTIEFDNSSIFFRLDVSVDLGLKIFDLIKRENK